MPLSPEMIQNILGFVAGLGGAAIGGWATLYATEKALKAEQKKAELEEQKEIRRLLSSLGVELNTLWQFHQKRIGEFIESLAEGQPLLFYYPLTQNYFIIYDSNASLIGKLEDSELRKAIVVTYNKCKKVVDGFVYNNTMFLDYRNQLVMADSEKDMLRVDAKLKEMGDYAKSIKADHFELKSYVDHLLALMESRGINVSFEL